MNIFQILTDDIVPFIEMIVWHVFFNLLIWYITLINYKNLNHLMKLGYERFYDHRGVVSGPCHPSLAVWSEVTATLSLLILIIFAFPFHFLSICTRSLLIHGSLKITWLLVY